MRSKIYLAVSGTIFGLVALAHLLRVIYQMPVHVGDWAFPMWGSWGGCIVAGGLCLSALGFCGGRRHPRPLRPCGHALGVVQAVTAR